MYDSPRTLAKHLRNPQLVLQNAEQKQLQIDIVGYYSSISPTILNSVLIVTKKAYSTNKA